MQKPFPWTVVLVVAVCLALSFGNAFVDHALHQAAQTRPTLYQFVQDKDAFVFMSGGVGSFGYMNHSKWKYAKWRANPARTTFEQWMFWETGFMWDIRNPPHQYPYPPLFEQKT